MAKFRRGGSDQNYRALAKQQRELEKKLKRGRKLSARETSPDPGTILQLTCIGGTWFPRVSLANLDYLRTYEVANFLGKGTEAKLVKEKTTETQTCFRVHAHNPKNGKMEYVGTFLGDLEKNTNTKSWDENV